MRDLLLVGRRRRRGGSNRTLGTVEHGVMMKTRDGMAYCNSLLDGENVTQRTAALLPGSLSAWPPCTPASPPRCGPGAAVARPRPPRRQWARRSAWMATPRSGAGSRGPCPSSAAAFAQPEGRKKKKKRRKEEEEGLVLSSDCKRQAAPPKVWALIGGHTTRRAWGAWERTPEQQLEKHAQVSK